MMESGHGQNLSQGAAEILQLPRLVPVVTERSVTAVALVTLVIVLSILGIRAGNTPIITMAGMALTGLFAWLQAPEK